jgi:hypothetical protein
MPDLRHPMPSRVDPGQHLLNQILGEVAISTQHVREPEQAVAVR